MISLKPAFSAAAVATLLGVGTLLATTGAASAYIACNRDGGDCWHADKKVKAPSAKLDYHPDDWYFHQKWDADKDHHYRDYHEGRGYYKGGIWIQL